MKKYEVYVDEQVSVWERVKVVVEAGNPEEAKKLSLDSFNWEESEVVDYFWETADSLGIEPADNQEPEEIK